MTTKILTVLMFGAVLVSAGYSQAKPVAHKFDEFTAEGLSTDEKWSAEVAKRAERVEKRMRIERGKRMIIIGYRGRVAAEDADDGNGLAREFRRRIGYDVVHEANSETIDGGIREFPTIEVWIAPKGAPIPDPTPSFALSDAIDCPVVQITSSDYNDRERTLRFRVDDGTKRLGELKWTVNGGTIEDRFDGGIVVRANRGAGSRAMVYLEVGDVPQPCQDRFAHTAYFRVEPQLVDQLGRVPTGHLRASLDNYFAELQNNPQSQGVVNIYGSRSGGPREAERFAQIVRYHIGIRRFDPARVTIAVAGYREEFRFDLWMVPPGADMPEIESTVDKKFTGRTATVSK